MTKFTGTDKAFSCWECFEGNGKICHDAHNDNLYDSTRWDNKGHGRCCNPESASEECNTKEDVHYCSQPSFIEYPE